MLSFFHPYCKRTVPSPVPTFYAQDDTLKEQTLLRSQQRSIHMPICIFNLLT